MIFQELEVGERFTVQDDTPAPRRAILRKASGDLALDDDGGHVPIDDDAPVDRIASPSLTHALWFEHDGLWRLILRWTRPREERARWTSLEPKRSGRTPADAEPQDDRRTRTLLASALQARGETRQAIDLYDELLAEEVEAPLLNNRGAARAASGDLEGAIADYSLALGIDDGLAQAYSNRGNALTKLGRHEDAIVDYDRALERADGVAAIHCNRGLARKLVGQLEGSLEDFDRALELDPRFGPAYLARGSVRALIGDFSAAVTDLRRYLGVAPDSPQASHVREALARLGRALDPGDAA